MIDEIESRRREAGRIGRRPVDVLASGWLTRFGDAPVLLRPAYLTLLGRAGIRVVDHTRLPTCTDVDSVR
jgi:hypothetical protein